MHQIISDSLLFLYVRTMHVRMYMRIVRGQSARNKESCSFYGTITDGKCKIPLIF